MKVYSEPTSKPLTREEGREIVKKNEKIIDRIIENRMKLMTLEKESEKGKQQIVYGNQQIAKGDQQIAKGDQQIAKGDQLLAYSKQKGLEGDQLLAKGDQLLAEGREKLAQAQKIAEERKKITRLNETKAFLLTFGVVPPTDESTLEKLHKIYLSTLSQTGVPLGVFADMKEKCMKLTSMTPFVKYLQEHKEITSCNFASFKDKVDDLNSLIKYLSDSASQVKGVAFSTSLPIEKQVALKDLKQKGINVVFM